LEDVTSVGLRNLDNEGCARGLGEGTKRFCWRGRAGRARGGEVGGEEEKLCGLAWVEMREGRGVTFFRARKVALKTQAGAVREVMEGRILEGGRTEGQY
jgi:hypothetical protein